MTAQPIGPDQGQYLGFFVAGEEYGVGILRVKEILEYEAITRVPTTPRFIRGVINLRGAVVPVVDLAAKFGLPETGITRRTCIVVVETAPGPETATVGVLVDSVSQVIELPASEIEPPPAFGVRVRVDCLVGMGKLGKAFVLLLDIDKVLSSDELLAARQSIADDGAAPVPQAEADHAVDSGPAVAEPV